MASYIVALLCVFGLAVGQILFKLSANLFTTSGTLLSLKPMSALFSAIALYGVTSLAWVWVLQRTQLGKVYPLMALAFVFVPLASYFLFGERFNITYCIGVIMIVIGVILTSLA
ncbi:EamA family transporter [Lelliottia amnigena]|uniref:EamA family transporter n=1 Tax=Lelliottia amnigena TaxID=61646 RepID=UPI00192B3337|nr:EamA family transporter [Lelliottia amnigena]MBL5921623.1 EamA family transporter [Lelliottia amnigena]